MSKLSIYYKLPIEIREIIDDFRKHKRYNELFKMSDSDTVQESVVDPEVYESIDSESAMQMLNVLPPATKLVFNLYTALAALHCPTPTPARL